MEPCKFASYRTHKKLYEAYDSNPDLWKPSLWDYFLCRWFEWNDEDDIEKFESYRLRSLENVQDCSYPFEMETCDYWCFKRLSNAIRYTKHASCRWMSRVNYFLARQVMPEQDWFHIADDEFGDSGHHYVMNNKGELLDPQGLALDFHITDYQQHFNPGNVTAHSEVMERLSEIDFEWMDALGGGFNNPDK